MPAAIDGVLCDLLMAVMDSPSVWAAATGDRELGMAWRHAATSRMHACREYRPYEAIVGAAARDLGLGDDAVTALYRCWALIEPWPDAVELERLGLPFGFLTNCSRPLAELAAARSGLAPWFVMSAEEAGYYKPNPEAYRRACDRAGWHAGSTLFVAGSAYDASGATDAGLRACLVLRGPDKGEAAQKVAILRSLREVAETIAAGFAT